MSKRPYDLKLVFAKRGHHDDTHTYTDVKRHQSYTNEFGHKCFQITIEAGVYSLFETDDYKLTFFGKTFK